MNNNRSKSYCRRLKDMAQKCDKLFTDDLRANAFLKDEGYMIDGEGRTKYARTINAYTDVTKIMYGPIFRSIEKQFFTSDLGQYFVKKIPVLDRPAALQSLFGDSPVVVGDFSSFECHHRGIFSKVIARAMTKLMGPHFDPVLKKAFSEHILGKNVGLFKGLGVKFQVDQVLMSGAVWTSLANCMLSFFLVSYMRLKELFPHLNGKRLPDHLNSFRGFCEGDDTIVGGGPYKQIFIDALGLKLKSELHPNIGTASFCGILKPLSVDTVLTDPVKLMSGYFNLPMAYAEAKNSKQSALIRAKALSTYYQYRSCPMVSAFAYSILRKTKSVNADSAILNYHQLDCFNQMSGRFYKSPPNVDPQTRDLFADLYGFSHAEQIQFEQQCFDWIDHGSRLYFPEDKFGRYIDWASEFVDHEKEREDVSLQNVFDSVVDRGPFNVRAFLEGSDFKDCKAKFRQVNIPGCPNARDHTIFL